MAREKSESERVYGMIAAGKSDAFILGRTDITEGSLRAYRANFTRQEKMGTPKRGNGLEPEGIKKIVVKCLRAGVPHEAIYADPRLRGVRAQTVAAYIAANTRGAYDN
jgi:hypothetical protein